MVSSSIDMDDYARLSCTSLSICEECTVVPHEDLVQHGTHNFMVHQSLVGLWTEDSVEGIRACRGEGNNSKARYWSSRLNRNVFAFGTICGDDNRRVLLDFSIGSAAAPNDDLDIGLCIILSRRICMRFGNFGGWCGEFTFVIFSGAGHPGAL